jgi:tRNA A37 threonylcarbamoyladenosine modification protein TsaB
MSDNKPLFISIELSQRNGTVAARIGSGDIIEIPAIQGDRDKDSVMPALEQAVLMVGGTPNQINTVFVSIGPGSFTGLRIATATAKMISCTTGAVVVPVETALGVVSADTHHLSRSIVVSAIKKENCWLSVVTKNPTWCCDGRLSNIYELPTYMEHGSILYGDSFLPDEILKQCEEAGVPIRAMQSTATSIMEVGQTFGSENHIDPTALLPLYPREPEAVRRWKETRPRSN